MKHHLAMSTQVRLPRPAAFEFFSDPANLARITPEKVHFALVTPPPIVLAAGVEFELSIRVFGLPLRWRSLIQSFDPPREFVDVQLSGPYKHWVHTHRFVEVEGGTQIEDSVEYELPFQPCGELAHPLVRRQLERIFAFRQAATERILAGQHDWPREQ